MSTESISALPPQSQPLPLPPEPEVEVQAPLVTPEQKASTPEIELSEPALSALPVPGANEAPEAVRTQATLLSALVQQSAPAAEPAAGFQKVGQQGLPAMRLLANAWQSPGAFLQAQQKPITRENLEATRQLAAEALEDASNNLLKGRALERLATVESKLLPLIIEMQGPGPRPKLEELFEQISSLELEDRSTLLRGLDFQIGDEISSSDNAPVLFNQFHSTMPEDPEAARAELLATGRTTFTGLPVTLEGIQANLKGRLLNLQTARSFVESCESPLLALRPLTRELATELPAIGELHTKVQDREDGVLIEAPRDDRRTDLVHAFQRTDEELAETLLLAGLVDEDQVDLAGHRASFEVTYFLASRFSPSPLSGLTSGLKSLAASPVTSLASKLPEGVGAKIALQVGLPAAEWTAGKTIGQVLEPLADLPKYVLGELIQGHGRFEAPLGDDPAPPEFE